MNWEIEATSPLCPLKPRVTISIVSSTRVFLFVAAALTCQVLLPHPGLNTLTFFVDAPIFAWLCEDRFSPYVPKLAVYLPGLVLGLLVVILAGGRGTARIWTLARTKERQLGEGPRRSARRGFGATA